MVAKILVILLMTAALINSQNIEESTGQYADNQQQPAPQHILADPAVTENYDESYKATYGELNMGRDFFEGDILLTREQSDYILQSQKNDGLQRRAIMRDSENLWPNGEVPYVIGKGLSDESKEYIHSAIEEWMDKTCVKLRPKKESDDDYVEFIYDGGCSSYVGRIGNRQTISVGSDDGSVTCRHGNIVHELAHSLGFFHEHSRPDRDDYIKVVMDNVMAGYSRNFRKESKETINSRGVAYDYDSVMHYGAFFFTKSRGLKTIETKKKGASIGQRVGLSDLDIKQARLLYKCDDKSGDKKSKTVKSTYLQKAFTRFKKKSSKAFEGKKTTAKDQIANGQTAGEAVQSNTQPSYNNSIQFTAVPVSVSQTPQQTNPANHENAATGASINQNAVSIQNPDATSSAIGVPAVSSTANQNGDISNQEEAQLTAAKAGTTNFILTDDDLGEENLGKSYFEGDMILSKDQRHFLESLKFDGNSEADKRDLIKNTTYLWPDRAVYYTFDDSVDEIGRENAEAAIQHWREKTCLKFQHRTNENDYINFVFEGGCASRVGRGGGMQKLTIGSTELRCKKGNIIHEMGHALGFFHEHSRPDRDEFVKVHHKNIMPGYERNFLKFSTKFIDSLNVPYDYGSIMHYGKTFFSKLAPILPTMTILKENDASGKKVEIGQRIALSDMDILQANLLYNCDGRKRLSDDEREELEAEYFSDNMIREGPCGDAYDAKLCAIIKAKGYCQKFPRTLWRACGNTCQLCGRVPPVNVHVGKKSSLLTKLKFDHHHHKH